MREIPLSGKNGAGKFILVDDEDYAWLSQYRWYWSESRTGFHIHTQIEGRRQEIHRLILPTEAQTVDHRNRNRLDNRRCNLRPATFSQNQANRDRLRNNTSGYKGVHWLKAIQRYQTRIKYCRKLRYLGVFDCIREAARNYDVFALLLFGEFAVLNFPDANYTDFVPKRLDLYHQLQEELNS
jgi:hypothetical protein